MRASLVAQTVKNLSTMQETWVRSLGWEDCPEAKMATHSSFLVWKSHGQRSLVHRAAKSRTRLSMQANSEMTGYESVQSSVDTAVPSGTGVPAGQLLCTAQSPDGSLPAGPCSWLSKARTAVYSDSEKRFNPGPSTLWLCSTVHATTRNVFAQV